MNSQQVIRPLKFFLNNSFMVPVIAICGRNLRHLATLMGGSECKQHGVIPREGWGLPLGTDDIAPPQIVQDGQLNQGLAERCALSVIRNTKHSVASY